MVLPRTAWIQLNCLALVLDVFTPAYKPEVTEATFSDSGSAPVPKILNMDPGLVIFRIWESNSCSDYSYHSWSNQNVSMLLLMKWPRRLLLLRQLKSESGSVSRSERKMQNPARVASGIPDLWPPLLQTWGMTPSATWKSSTEEQTIDHIVLQCLIHQPPMECTHGLMVLDVEKMRSLLNTCPNI